MQKQERARSFHAHTVEILKGQQIKINHTVLHPKYYKHLKKGVYQSYLGRQKMEWFLADQPVHQVKLKY